MSGINNLRLFSIGVIDLDLYNKLFTEVCGMFNPLHYFSIILFFGLLFLTLYLSRNLTKAQTEKLLRWITVAVSVMEVIKITSRIRQGLGPDSWVPLYYCSLFIFAIWFAVSGNAHLKRAGFSYIALGGIAGSVFFTFYPSTSLGMYPFLHTATLHSFVYHLIMCYTGCLVLWKGIYAPKRQDALHYFLFIFSACIPAVILNETVGTNCMFLRHPFGLPILQPILETSELLYMAIVCVAQAVCVFWLGYGVYYLVRKIVCK